MTQMGIEIMANQSVPLSDDVLNHTGRIELIELLRGFESRTIDAEARVTMMLAALEDMALTVDRVLTTLTEIVDQHGPLSQFNAEDRRDD